jgi:hypothetical protein
MDAAQAGRDRLREQLMASLLAVVDSARDVWDRFLEWTVCWWRGHRPEDMGDPALNPETGTVYQGQLCGRCFKPLGVVKRRLLH